jgi:hypothetical protein
MKLNRRKFFGVAAASPLAAKEAAIQAAEALRMEASGMSVYSDSLYTGINWDDARRSRTIDPDIAAMRSVSMSAKLDMQWKRNYDTLLKRAYKQQEMERLKRRFFKENTDVAEY